MRLTLCIVCLCLAQYTFAQNSGPGSDFNFGLFSGGGSSAGGGSPTNAPPGLVSANPLGNNNGGLQQNSGMGQSGMPTGLQNTGLNQNSAMMNGQTGLNQNQMMGGQNGMMNPSGMAMPGQNGMMQNGMSQNGMMGNGMQNGMMGNGMQNGMAGNGMQNGMMGNSMQNGMMQNSMQNGMMQNGMQNGMMQNGMQNGMMQNGMQNGMMGNGMMQNGMQNGMMGNGMMQNGMMQNGMNFQDPTTMSSFNGNSLNQLAFDPSQTNLFQNQLNSQNMPQFGTQTQFGQGQFGQQMPPFGQQMPFATPFGPQFGSPFTSQPGFGMFPDPMMNAFAPNPFQMSASPMMGVGPMGAVFMPGMEISNLLFDANGNVVGTTGGIVQQTGMAQGTGGLSQSSGNSFVFPQPTQTMLPVPNGIALPGGFGSTTITANPAILGMGQFAQTQGLTQGGLSPTTNAGQMQMNTLRNSAQGLPPQLSNARFALNTLPGQGIVSSVQTINRNTNAFSTVSNSKPARTNSFALDNQGMSVNNNVKPFSGIVPHQQGTVLENPNVLQTQNNNFAASLLNGNQSGSNAISTNSNKLTSSSALKNTL